MKFFFIFLTLFGIVLSAVCQIPHTVSGNVYSANEPLKFASISLIGTKHGTITDSLGGYKISVILPGTYRIKASAVGYLPLIKPVIIADSQLVDMDFYLMPDGKSLNEVVITGTLKEVSRLESPVAVEVYSP
ncbi:MAG: carboxypeptidase-like regulatory domain-containing protein, partial [Flavobacterium sp.]|nr:carboxypeptidase-like regulatory domain-containing protein [Pedobacter sp.]